MTSKWVFLTFSLIGLGNNSATIPEHEALSVDDRIKGSVMGAAIGDALGAPTEFMPSLKDIQSRYGLKGVTGILDLIEAGDLQFVNGRFVLPYTDDTAMSMVTMQVLAEAKQGDWSLEKTMEQLAVRFVEDMHNPEGWAKPSRAPGNACIKNVHILERRIKEKSTLKGKIHSLIMLITGECWWQAGGKNDGGCGSVMHAHPFGLVFYDDPDKAAQWAAEHSKLTHGHPMAIAACAAMAKGVALAVQGKEWDVLVKEMVIAARQYDEPTAKKMEDAYDRAQKLAQKSGEDRNWSFGDTMLYSQPFFKEYLGWRADDAISATIYAASIKPSKNALLLGVNTPGDSDSIASMAGALVGAWNGIKSIPADWTKYLEEKEHLEILAHQLANS